MPQSETVATEPQTQAPQKRERTEAQKASLEAARAKALQVRRENALLREKERALKTHERAEKVRQVEQAYSAIQPKIEPETWDDLSEEEEQGLKVVKPAPAKKRKPARRVIVTEVSSAEESDNDSTGDVEVVLPRARPPPKPPTAQEINYQRTLNKMFNYGI